jgi:hypothetical protein
MQGQLRCLQLFSCPEQADLPLPGPWESLGMEKFKKPAQAEAVAESCAMDRTNMLAGNPAKAVCFQRKTTDFALLPADLDGATPPPSGSPDYQMDLATSTKLNLYKFHVDSVTTSNSTLPVQPR